MTNLADRTDTGDAPHQPPWTLTEPFIAGRFWRNRHRNEAVLISLEPFEGITLISIRVHQIDQRGRMRPTTRGISLRVDQLPQLTNALLRAEDWAVSLGLVRRFA